MQNQNPINVDGNYSSDNFLLNFVEYLEEFPTELTR